MQSAHQRKLQAYESDNASSLCKVHTLFPKEQQSLEISIRCCGCLGFCFEKIKQVVSSLNRSVIKCPKGEDMHLSFSPSLKQSQCIAWMRSLLESRSCHFESFVLESHICVVLGKAITILRKADVSQPRVLESLAS